MTSEDERHGARDALVHALTTFLHQLGKAVPHWTSVLLCIRPVGSRGDC
jgi:hypothetical protein